MTDKKTQPVNGLPLLREPFPDSQISLLPKQSKRQTEDRAGYINCKQCGGYHHRNATHLSYVGHAALTNRLLDADPQWNWEPVTVSEDGTPAIDQNGGMWIRLTVCGVTRLGYGHPDGKRGGDAIKETIGDALRNAAMRFGAALDLWHKGESLRATHEEPGSDEESGEPPKAQDKPAAPTIYSAAIQAALETMSACTSLDGLSEVWKAFPPALKALGPVRSTKDKIKAVLLAQADKPADKPASNLAKDLDDEIPF